MSSVRHLTTTGGGVLGLGFRVWGFGVSEHGETVMRLTTPGGGGPVAFVCPTTFTSFIA